MFMAGISGIIPGANSVAVGAPEGTDPHWESTVLLLSGDGSSGSRILPDESFAAHGNASLPGGVANDAKVSILVKKFGTGSIRFDGNEDVLVFNDHADWHLTGDFTIDGWHAFDAAGVDTDQAIIDQYHTNSLRSWLLQYNGAAATNALQFIGSSDGSATTTLLAFDWTPSDGVFYHISVDRSGNVFRLYIDGTMVDSTTNAFSFFNSTAGLRIGTTGSGVGEQRSRLGYSDEVRVTKGVARYASDGGFSVPTAAYPRS